MESSEEEKIENMMVMQINLDTPGEDGTVTHN